MNDQSLSRSGGRRPSAQPMRTRMGCRPFRPSAHPMRIDVRGHYAHLKLPPGLVAAVGRLLESRVPCFSLGGPQGYRQHPRTDHYYVVDKAGRLRLPAGLVPRVVSFLRQQGHQVTVTDQTSWPQLAAADVSLLEAPWLDSDDNALLKAIQQNARGQLHVRRQDDLARHVGLLGDFLPKANIAVITANNEQAKGLFITLKQHTNRPLALSPESNKQQGRTFIGPAATFARFAPRDWDVLIFVGDEAALGKQVQETLVEKDQQLRYVFLDQNARIGPRTQFRLEVFFGTAIYQPSDPYGAAAEVNVVFLAVPEIKASRKLTGLERKRKLIWHNTGRNHAVAGIAGAFERGDVADLEKYGAPASAITALGVQDQTHASVSVLVESTEHAQQLQTLLHDWHLAHVVPGPAREAVRFTDCSFAVNHATISTMVYAEKHGILSDVLIRADGGEDWPLSADRFPWKATGAGDSVLVVDFVDHGGGGVASSVRRRTRAYQRLGWQVQAVPETLDGAGVSTGASNHGKQTAGKKQTGRHRLS